MREDRRRASNLTCVQMPWPFQSRICMVSLFIFTAATNFTSVCLGDFITTLNVTTSTQTSGQTLYHYTLSNSATSTLPAVEFTLSIDPTAALQSITGPSGWSITYNSGDSVVDWASLDAMTDLQPGLDAVFSFDSMLPPLSQNYLILGISDNPIDIETNTGMILGPGISSVPEASSLVLLGVVASITFLYCSISNKYKGVHGMTHSCD